MSGTPVLGLLHTSPVHVATFDALARQEAPGLRLRHLVREDLLAGSREHGPEAVAESVRDALATLGAEVVLCTCSTIGGVAERVGGGSVLRVDRPMAAAAVAAGGPIAVLAALESTLGPTVELLAQEADRAGRSPDVRTRVVGGAWDRFEDGDLDGYRGMVADAVRTVAREVAPAVVVLAQASMAPAHDSTDDLTDVGVPVLSSPRLGLCAAAALASR